MKAEEIDRLICDCPYFQGKNTIDRSALGTHIGGCDLEFHYRKICPSKECLCAKRFGLLKEGRKDEIERRILCRSY